ncbi:MAG: hypothetical protein SGILL_009284, partial [Bacillariaceae sp.]
GLGCLGVVVEITMQCIPAHNLVEHTFVLTRDQAIQQKDELLEKHKHMRFMWIPYTDAVVVVTNDPDDQVDDSTPRNQTAPGSSEERNSPLTDLLKELCTEHNKPFSEEDVKGMGFGEVRDALLAFDPLSVKHVKRCNRAEAEFWKKNEGQTNSNDMEFMQELLRKIEENGVPAHSPIEQRWSASSSSPMSPAHGEPDEIFTWVGIINYLPTDDPKQRSEITRLFTGKYCDLVRTIGRPLKSVSHWAKLEEPQSVWKAVELKTLYLDRFPIAEFNAVRGMYDPKNIMSSPLLNLVLGKPTSVAPYQPTP